MADWMEYNWGGTKVVELDKQSVELLADTKVRWWVVLLDSLLVMKMVAW